MSYGLELRERVIEFVLEGKTMQEAHKTFKVHYNTISKWLNRYWEELATHTAQICRILKALDITYKKRL
jgi:transposase-like protein